ncbi:MAG: translocation/assembly module TamB domain-containing protein [Planctomycetes bacterium]|nr:translocation/assembly module TamB domain-containing protein [Planctomycetota bacterium]
MRGAQIGFWRRLKPQSWQRGCAYAALLLATLVVGAYLLRGPLFSRPLGHLAARKLSQALGGEFEARAVRGSWLTDAVVVDLRMVEAPTTGPLADLSWQRLEVSYSLVDLMRGRSLAGLHSLRIEGLELDLDLTRPSAPKRVGKTGARHPFTLPERLPKLDLRGHLHLRMPLRSGGSGSIDVGAFSVTGDGTDTAIALERLSYAEAGWSQDHFEVQIARPTPNTIRVHSTEPLAGIDIRDLEVDFTNGRSGALELAAAGGRITATAAGDHGEVHIDGVDFARLPDWIAALGDLPHSGQLSASATVRRAPDGWVGSMDLSAAEVAWHGIRFTAVAGAGSWDGRVAAVERLSVQSDAGTIALAGVRVEPRERWPLADLSTIAIDIPDVLGTAKRIGVRVPERMTDVLPTTPVALKISAEGENGAVRASSIAITAAGIDLAYDGSAGLPPASGDWRTLVLHGAWRIGLGAGALPSLVDRFDGAIAMQGTIDGEVAQPKVAFTGALTACAIAKRPIGDLDLAGELAWPRLRIDRLRADITAGTISLTGGADLERAAAEDVHMDIALKDLSRLAGMVPEAPPLAGAVSGTIAWTGGWRGSPWDMLCSDQVAVDLVGKDIRVGGRTIGRVVLAGSLAGGEAKLPRFSVEGPIAGVLAGSASFGADRSLDAVVETFEVSQGDRRGRLQEPMRLRWTSDRLEVGPGTILGFGGRIDCAVDLGERLELSLRIMNLHVDEAFAAVGLSQSKWTSEGVLHASLSASGDPAAPEASLRVRTDRMRIGGRTADVAIDAVQTTAGMRLTRFDAGLEHAFDLHVRGALPMCAGLRGFHRGRARDLTPALSLTAFVASVPELYPSGFIAAPDAGCAGIALDIDEKGARVRLRVRELLAPLAADQDEGVRLPRNEIAEIDIDGEAGANGWFGTIAARDTGGLDLSGHMHGEQAFDPAEAMTFARTFRDQPFTAALRMANLDIARFSPLIPQLVRLGGKVGGGLQASGTMKDPLLSGSLVIDQVSLKARSNLPAISDGHGFLALSKGLVTIDDVTASLGYSPLTLHGTIDIVDPRKPTVDLAVAGKNLLLVRNQYLRLRGDCDGRLKGPVEALALSGQVVITDALYSKPMELLSRLRPTGGHGVKGEGVKLFSIRERPLSNMTFDVDIVGNDSFRIHTNVLRTTASMDLHLGGNGESPVPRGRIWCSEGRLKMPFTHIHVTGATVVFPFDAPFFPRLEAGEGEARMKGYDLMVHASGELPDVEVQVDAQPPLSDNEAILLLTTGLTGREREENGQRTELALVGKYLSKEIYHELFGPGDPDKEPGILDLDRLDLSVGADDSTTTQSHQETIDAEYELSRHYYLHGERDRFGGYNMGLIWRVRFH